LSRDQVIGVLILLGSVLGILIYGWLVFLSPWVVLVLEITGFVAVATVLVVLAWIGYTLATIPPPKPIEEIERELEEELAKLEEKGESSEKGENLE
jgi:predicted DNA-binding transcriptional regulator